MSRDGSGRPRFGGDAFGGRDAGALPPAARRALRSMYAPPAGDDYWDGLEARVLARVRGARLAAPDDWTAVLASWGRVGVAAAAAAALVAGVALAEARRRTDAQNARAVAVLVNEPAAVPAVAATGPDEGRAREATLQYLIAH
jgi:hypothetical protein